MADVTDKVNKTDKIDTKKPVQTSWKVGNNAKLGQATTGITTKTITTAALERHHLNTQDEAKILRNWSLLKNNVLLINIMDTLIEKGVYTPDQWMSLKHNEATEGEKVEEFLYHLLKCKAETYAVFIDALKTGGYSNVVSQLDGKKMDVSPSVSLSSSGNSTQRMTGRPTAHTQNYSYQAQKKPASNQKHGSNTSRGEVTQSAQSDVVRQEDLFQMKEEITDELRQLRKNIEQDRDQDRLELQILQQKHIEMHEDLAKVMSDRKLLETELAKVMETVGNLTVKMDAKNTEFIKMQEKSYEDRKVLEMKSADLQRMVAEKEKEAIDITKCLKVKEAEYKQLQATLENLKEEHEERLGRLKALNKEKVALTKEVQTLQRERKNLEVKIKSLEEHIRLLQVKHTKETNDITDELERQKTLLTDKEKEKEELAKKLEASRAENDNLREYSKGLENTLQKSEDAKAHLVQKAKDNLAKYAIPPFTVGRMGWGNRKYMKKP